MKCLLKLIQRVQTKRAAHKTAEILYRMTDRDLADIGITRGDIPNVARGEYTIR